MEATAQGRSSLTARQTTILAAQPGSYESAARTKGLAERQGSTDWIAAYMLLAAALSKNGAGPATKLTHQQKSEGILGS